MSYLDLAAETALIVSLIRNQLFRVYRFFFAYLTTDAVETAAGALFQTNRHLYANIYFAGQGLKIILGVFVVLELYQLALEQHPALATFGRNTVIYVMSCAALVAALTLSLDRAVPPGRSPVVHRFNTFERTMDLTMLVFLIVAIAFMLWFPVRMKRNGAFYVGGFVIYFLSRSAGLLLRNLTPQFRGPIDNAILVASIVCLLVWLFALTPKGEQITTIIGHRWRPAAAKRLTDQLDAINAKLMRLSRR